MEKKKKLGMRREEFADAVMDARLKRERGEKLTKREELLLAFGHWAPRCHHPKHR